MSTKRTWFGSQGQASPRHDPTPQVWHGWKGKLAHPDSPLGGGGPGLFREARPLGGDGGSETAKDSEFVPPHPDAPIPLQGNETPATTGAKAKPAPTQNANETAVELLKKKDAFLDVEVKYQIMADEIDSSINGAETKFAIPYPEFSPPDEPNQGDPGTMTWKTTIEIRTKYESDEMRGFFSCYGRGTTPEDRKAGDITVGFHESCHRNDFVDYLKNNALPALPKLKTGMTKNEFTVEQNKFTVEYNKYEPAMKTRSDTNTDEVGLKKSTWKAKGGTGEKCFKHNPES